MREILFRGKRIDNGQWVEGCLIIDERRNHYIGEYIRQRVESAYCCTKRSGGKTINRFYGIGFVMVLPETVGQYTDLTDKNGKKIFEGDIVKSYNASGKMDGIGVVHWSDLFVSWHIAENQSMYSGRIAFYKVIGNIHDNPELLEDMK